MNALTLALKQKLMLASISIFSIILNPAMANPNDQAVKEVQMTKELAKQDSKYKKQDDKSQKFRGVYYGVLPCKQECPGVKATLSLKNRKNYLLVTQIAKESSREYYEKGKYDWDEESGLVTLTSRKDSSIRKLQIKNDKSLIMLSFGGIDMNNNPKKFTLTKHEEQKSGRMHMMH